jgi:hypothetical protein
MSLSSGSTAPRGGKCPDGGDERRDLLGGGIAADDAHPRGFPGGLQGGRPPWGKGRGFGGGLQGGRLA